MRVLFRWAVSAGAVCLTLVFAGEAAATPLPASSRADIAGPFNLGGRLFSVVGQPMIVKGRVSAYAPGQTVRIEMRIGTRLVRRATVSLRPAGAGRGSYSYTAWISGDGRISTTATHAATPSLGAFRAVPASVLYYRPVNRVGGNGIAVGVLHAMLKRLGYWAPNGHHFGAGTGKAVLAFRKVNRMERVEHASTRIYALLQQGRGMAHARYPQLGVHLEADLTRQVLTFFHGARPVEVHVISSGKPSTPTILGRFRFYMKESGTNSHGMVDSSYFHNGYAVHGFAELPVYPASHGCLRTWVPNAWHIYRQIRIGEWIAVFR